MKPFLFLFAVPILAAVPSIAHASEVSDVYEKHRQVFLATPEIGEVTLCINGACETFDTTQLQFERKGGTPELLYERPKDADSSQAVSRAAGALLGGIREVVGVGGSFKVDLETRVDGTFKLHVEGSFGTGAAATPAAGGQTPAPAPALPSRPGGGGGSSGHAVLQ